MLIEGRGKKAAGSQLCDPNTEQGKECEKKIGSPVCFFPLFLFTIPPPDIDVICHYIRIKAVFKRKAFAAPTR